MPCWNAPASAPCSSSAAAFATCCASATRPAPACSTSSITLPTLLYEEVVEIGGRVDVHGAELEPLDEPAAQRPPSPPPACQRHRRHGDRADARLEASRPMSAGWPNWRTRPASPRSPPATRPARCCASCRAATPRWSTPISRRSCAAMSARSPPSSTACACISCSPMAASPRPRSSRARIRFSPAPPAASSAPPAPRSAPASTM